MSIFLSDAARAEFDAEVKHAYQMSPNMRSAVTFRGGVVGDTYNFRTMGQGLAKQKAVQDDVVPMNVVHAKVPVTLADWHAAEYTDIFAAATVNFDEQQELAYTIAQAIQRREDQLIIDALEAANGTNMTVSQNIGGTNSGLNIDKIRKAARLLDDNGVPMNDRYYVGAVRGKEDLLGLQQATSSDYANVKALVNGDIDTFMGFKFFWVPTLSEGGLQLSANVRKNFAFHKASVGLAVGLDNQVKVDWVPQKTSWLACQTYKAGAIYREGTTGTTQIRGIVELSVYEA